MTPVDPVAGEAGRHYSTVVWLPSLSGLRFGAVLLVFGFHLYAADIFTSGSVHTLLGWVFGPGAGGLSLFFVLSGFVLTWSARPDDTAPQFWWRRFVRIYPTHAATSVAALIGVAVAGAGVSAATIVPNLLLVHAWVPDAKVFFGLNTVSWFVACEAFFYGIFPLLHRVLSRLPGKALWPGAMILLVATWAIPLAAQPLPEATRYWIIWILPLARLPEFVAGMLLARIVREGQASWLRVPPLAVIVAGAYYGSALLPQDFRHVAATATPLALLVAALAAADAMRAQAAGDNPGASAGVSAESTIPWPFRVMGLLGEYAFAFFMVHQLVLRVVAKLAGPTASEGHLVAVVGVALLVVLVVSWLLHHFVNLPAARLLTRMNPPTSGSRSRIRPLPGAS